jgi:pimeloyl-ACP methyl ester carboxylesterase
MDLPGHGDSENAVNPERTYSIDGYADAAVEVLNELGIDKTVILGWSLGGHIGISIMGRYDRLLGLMITGTPPVGDNELDIGFIPSEHMGLAGQDIFSDDEVSIYSKLTCGENAPYEGFLYDAVKRTHGKARELMFAKFASGDLKNQRQIVETSTCPLAIANGGKEPFVNNEFVKSLNYANLWEEQVHIIENIGHAPFWEAPKLFDPIFERFLKDIYNL